MQNSSTTSLHSTTTFSSTAPLTSSQPPKDFQSAFEQLQSTYGVNGHTPTPISTSAQKWPKWLQRRPSAKPSPSQLKPLPVTDPSSPSKNYEGAFAQLSSSYGFGGGPNNASRKL
ncbi:hypothetical protein SERLA73DRAFT_148247 [Serpula lacrymans var. lacrymans S7.3]|uniref:Uncharacterized protein n=1 Tax=Serpula lacrymans var. lacrymans (strain S7.3) TaxID=936435 RepID=F8QIY1_SERL3|nr:hypothetical protein SERLA73DRAFT_148247 [Serpula lacrymans var. lacrymans S7.3]